MGKSASRKSDLKSYENGQSFVKNSAAFHPALEEEILEANPTRQMTAESEQYEYFRLAQGDLFREEREKKVEGDALRAVEGQPQEKEAQEKQVKTKTKEARGSSKPETVKRAGKQDSAKKSELEHHSEEAEEFEASGGIGPKRILRNVYTIVRHPWRSAQIIADAVRLDR